MTLDIALTFVALGLVSALLAVLAGKRIYRTSPVFFSYMSYYLVGGTGGLLAFRYFAGGYLQLVLIEAAIDFLLYFCVLVELGKNVLRCNRASQSLQGVAVLVFVFVSILLCSLSSWAAVPGRSFLSNVYVFTMRANDTLQFAGFLALVLWSSLRKFHWPGPELRIVTGLGISTFVWFVVAILHARITAGMEYHRLDQFGQAVYLAVLAYWLHYFWIKADGVIAVRDPGAHSGKSLDRNRTEHTRLSVAAGRTQR